MALIEQHRQGKAREPQDVIGLKGKEPPKALPKAEEEGPRRPGDPTDAERVEMLQTLLRTAERQLKKPLTSSMAARILDFVDTWTPFAAGHADLETRLAALRSAADLVREINA